MQEMGNIYHICLLTDLNNKSRINNEFSFNPPFVLALHLSFSWKHTAGNSSRLCWASSSLTLLFPVGRNSWRGRLPAVQMLWRLSGTSAGTSGSGKKQAAIEGGCDPAHRRQSPRLRPILRWDEHTCWEDVQISSASCDKTGKNLKLRHMFIQETPSSGNTKQTREKPHQCL